MQDNIVMFPHPSPDEGSRLPRHNLPAPLTPLVGREHAVIDLCTRLRHQEVRLLTLTGTAGVGKTRLGLQVATELIDTFADGVCFVSLAPLSDPELILPTLTQALRLPEARGRSPLEHLQAYMQDKHLLLLLDNFEQVADAASLLVELLQSCPDLKIVVTSRALLRVRGEYEVRVSPLDLPDLKQHAGIETLAHNAAVTLFMQRAQAIAPDFTLTETNAHIIAEICTHLDGLPLTIELAAARIELLSPQQLLRRLEHRLEVLTGGAQDLPVRQQTLRSTLQWSYDLLNSDEQWLFRLLSVFVGGCMLETVEVMCRALGDGVTAVLDGVQRLLDSNLIFESKHPDGELRLMMLETIREFGQECLTKSDEAEMTQCAHAEYYLSLAEEAEPKLKSAEQLQWLERLEQEYDNLRAALNYLLKRGQFELALRMVGALGYFYLLRAHVKEGLVLTRELGDRWVTAYARHALRLFAYKQGDYTSARAFYEESLAASRAMREIWMTASSLAGLGEVASAQEQFRWAARLWGAMENLCQPLGTPLLPIDQAAYESAAAATRIRLGEEAFTVAWAEGRTMSLDQVLADWEPPPVQKPTPTALPLTEVAPPPLLAGLTAREMDVLRLLAQGLTSAQIAEQLVISLLTVNTHVRSIYSKLGVTSRSAATRYAIEHKLV